MGINTPKQNFYNRLRVIVFGLGLILTQTLSANGAFGDPDPTFGFLGSGKINDISLQYSPWEIALQPDGKILVVGMKSESGYKRLILRRYHANGTPDFGFGDDGTAVTYNGALGKIDGFPQILVQDDGKILVAGGVTITIPGPTGTDYKTFRGAIWRFNPDGYYDFYWGSAGRLLLQGTGVASFAAYQPAGSDSQNIFAAVNTIAPDDYLLYRLLSNGSPDSTFGGGDGVTTIPREITKILVSGGALYMLDSNYMSQNIRIYKRTLQNLPYRGFGTQGIFTGNPLTAYGCTGKDFNRYTSFGIQSDGKIVTGGQNHTPYFSDQGLLVRHMPNGAFDLSFNNMKPCDGDFSAFGVERIRIHTNDEIFYRKIMGIYRRMPDGTPNGHFQPFEYPRDYAVRPDGKVVTVGIDSNHNLVQLSRYLE